ncbi:MAG TPA: AraC family transcriptional regulator, partial [Rhizomicrobium sp.]
SRASGGVRQDVRALPGTTWLCPAGIREEATRLSDDIPEVLHVYIPQHSFLLRNRDEGLAFAAHDLRYEADVRSPVIRSLLDQVIGELRHETASGGQRMDSLAGELIAVLAGGHAEAHGERRAARRTASLDRRRLARVLDHIEDRLGEAVSVSELAAVACMSLFHFTRAFSAAMGRPPHAYLSERRLDRARHLLAHDGGTLAGIALVCGFSSQANFSKAFRRATGVSPGAYRLGRRD